MNKSSKGKASPKTSKPKNNNQKAPKSKGQNNSRASRNFRPAQAAPVALQSQFQYTDPIVTATSDGCIVEHTERIATINGSVAFTVTTIPCQPGLVTSNPWLANIANRYESYKPVSIEYNYKNKCSSAFLGDVTLAFDFDAADPAPGSTLVMESYACSKNTSPWLDVRMPLTQKNMKKEKEWYTRSQALAANLDIKTYDLGNLYIATEGQAAATLVGYVYKTYKYHFLTPQLNFSDVVVGGLVTGGGTQTGANPFGSVPVVDTQSIGISVDTGSVITLAYPGTYTSAVTIVGTVLSAPAANLSTGGTFISTTNVINSAATSSLQNLIFVTTVPNVTLTYSLTATTVTAATYRVGVAPLGSQN